jgi:hypothetical protein
LYKKNAGVSFIANPAFYHSPILKPKLGAQDEIRTHTDTLLRRVPLPVGLLRRVVFFKFFWNKVSICLYKLLFCLQQKAAEIFGNALLRKIW